MCSILNFSVFGGCLSSVVARATGGELGGIGYPDVVCCVRGLAGV